MNDGMTKRRIEWLDVMKGILIIFVVLSHATPAAFLRRFYTPFFLTMFFFASGYTFSRKESFSSFMLGKVFRLLVPMLTLGLIKIAVAALLEHADIWERISGLFLQIAGRQDDLWFLGCLFSTLLLFYSVEALSKGRAVIRHIISGALMAAGFLLTCLYHVRLPWHLEISLIMVFYMALGKTASDYEESFSVTKAPVIGACLMASIYPAFSALISYDTDIHLGRIEAPHIFLIASLLAVWPLICLSKWLAGTKLHYIRRLLILAGQNTLFIYAFQNYIIKPFCFLAERIKPDQDSHVVLPVICALFTVVVLLFPAILVRKYAPWAVGEKKTR